MTEVREQGEAAEDWECEMCVQYIIIAQEEAAFILMHGIEK